jgi:hypothetical protein
MLDFTKTGEWLTNPSFWGMVVLCVIALAFIKVLYDYFTSKEPERPFRRSYRHRWTRSRRFYRPLTHK